MDLDNVVMDLVYHVIDTRKIMGNELTTLTCPACNAPIPGPGKCEYCGAEVREAQPAPESSGAESPEARPVEGSVVSSEPIEIPAWITEARDLLRDGLKINAIKRVRQGTNCGLKEAKDFVESGALDDPKKAMDFAEGLYTPPSTPSSSSEACFPGWVEVGTPGGNAPIASLEAGDEVWAWSTRLNDRVPSVITSRIEYEPARLWVVELTHGEPLWTTSHHRMLTLQGWRRVDQLEQGQQLRRTFGKTAEIRFVRATERVEPVFNLHVAGEHTFLVGDLVAHSFTTLPTIRGQFHRLFIDPNARRPGTSADHGRTPTPSPARTALCRLGMLVPV